MERSSRLVGLRRLVVAAVGIAVVLGADGAVSLAGERRAPRYVVEATVIQEPGRGPRLCWGVEDSLPPQCSAGIPLDDWAWADVPRVERRRGTTWGDYRLVGTYDGGRFRVQRVTTPRPARPGYGIVDFRSRCEAPPGGWRDRDETRLGTGDFSALVDAARASPDFAGMWFGGAEGIQLTNVAFTGSVDARRPALEELWGGPLCVLRYRYSSTELLAVQAALSPDLARRLGLELTGSYVDEPGNRLVLGVVTRRPGAQARLDQRFGRGVVVLDPWLERVR